MSSAVPSPSPDQIRAACDRIVSSPIFENSGRMTRFLRFTVEKTLAGESDQLKEYLLGVEVFDRQESFDPKIDTIVRVEARRLRRKLKEYYEAQGAGDPVRIEMPTPGYTPVFLNSAPAAVSRSRPPAWVYAALAAGLVAIGGGIWWWNSSGIAAGKIDSIAVLPFSNLSADKDQDYFCDGFTEELISTLSAIDGLRVVARTSAFEFKNKAGDIREIGRKLGAGAILEGSVRRDGDTMRITAQLIQTADGYHIWSRSFDRSTKDAFATQEEISRLIAETFQRRFDRAPSPSPKLEAHDLYLLGRYHWNKLDPEEFPKAIEYFEKSIAVDPHFSLAYSGLSDVYSYMIDLDLAPTSEILPKARAAADRALALDDSLAEAHTARGLVAHELEWDQTRAQKEYLRAIQLKPSYAYGIHWYAHWLDSMNRGEDGIKEMNRALALDPLSRMYLSDVGMMEYAQGHFDRALATFEKVRQLEPDFVFLNLGVGMVYEAQGDLPRALTSLQTARKQLDNAPIAVTQLGQAQALSGDLAAARRTLSELEEMSRSSYVPATAFALLHYALGDKDGGLAALRKAVDDHNGQLVWMKRWPSMAQIAADPRAKELLDRAGGPPPR